MPDHRNSHKNLDIQRGTNPPNRDVNATNRCTLAIKLRAMKMTYESIAAQCGYANASSARKAVMRELDRCVIKNVEDLRTEELDSLEQLELVCWKRLQDKDYAKSQMFCVDRIVAIKERRARLMGLDKKNDDEANGNIVVVREVPPGYLLSEVKS